MRTAFIVFFSLILAVAVLYAVTNFDSNVPDCIPGGAAALYAPCTVRP